MSNVYVFDFDGTITQSLWRNHHRQERDYSTFDSLLAYDEPNNDVVGFIKMLQSTGQIIIVSTAKYESRRAMVTKWLLENKISPRYIYMRDAGDSETASATVKYKNLQRILLTFSPTEIICIEDDAKCIEMYEANNCIVIPTRRT